MGLMYGVLLAVVILCLPDPVAGGAVELTRENWHLTQGQAWYIKFYQQGCTHCQRMAPLWQAVAEQLPHSSPPVRVGKVDCSAHNGIGRSFGVHRFPTVLMIDADGSVYEFFGRRGLFPLVSFGRGGFRKQQPKMLAPSVLLTDASQLYLMMLALWRPFAMSLGLALGIALCLKGGAMMLLRLLRPKDD